MCPCQSMISDRTRCIQYPQWSCPWIDQNGPSSGSFLYNTGHSKRKRSIIELWRVCVTYPSELPNNCFGSSAVTVGEALLVSSSSVPYWRCPSVTFNTYAPCLFLKSCPVTRSSSLPGCVQWLSFQRSRQSPDTAGTPSLCVRSRVVDVSCVVSPCKDCNNVLAALSFASWDCNLKRRSGSSEKCSLSSSVTGLRRERESVQNIFLPFLCLILIPANCAGL